MFVYAGASGPSVIAMKLPGEEINGRFTLSLSPGNRPTLKREFMTTSFLRSFCFSQISEARRKLLSASVSLKCFLLKIIFTPILGFSVSPYKVFIQLLRLSDTVFGIRKFGKASLNAILLSLGFLSLLIL